MTRDISAEVTAQIVAALETDGLKWLRGWRSCFPRSLATGKTYNGINALLLLMAQEAKGYKSPLWVTFREAQKRGGHVLKGEKATPIVYYEIRKRTEQDSAGVEQEKTFPFMRLYYVFNLAQTVNVKVEEQPAPEFSPIDAAEMVAKGYDIAVKHGGDRAFYSVKSDYVQLPHREDFISAESFYATLFHEFAHSTGAKQRLNRDLSGAFGSETYAYEELIAELASAFICAGVGIDGDAATQNNAAYVQNWLQALKGDKRLIFKAAKAAQAAADLINSHAAQRKELAGLIEPVEAA